MNLGNILKVKSGNLMASLGMSLSFICAIHCLATPFLLAFAPVFGSIISHESELYILGTSFVFAFYTFVKDCKQHGNLVPSLIALVGASLLLLGIMAFHGSRIEFVIMSAGGFIMAFAYYLNWRAGRKACII